MRLFRIGVERGIGSNFLLLFGAVRTLRSEFDIGRDPAVASPPRRSAGLLPDRRTRILAIDIGNPTDIDQLRKQEVGRRLALAARDVATARPFTSLLSRSMLDYFLKPPASESVLHGRAWFDNSKEWFTILLVRYGMFPRRPCCGWMFP